MQPKIRFTAAEARILNNFGLGWASKETAAQFGCSVKTIERHWENILSKLPDGQKTRAMAFVFYIGQLMRVDVHAKLKEERETSEMSENTHMQKAA